MTSLDINTPLGQETLKHEYRAAKLFEMKFCRMKYVKTDPKERAKIDAIILKDGELFAVAETKARNLTMDDLRRYEMRWLVTAAKIDKCADIAEALWVPFWGFLYLVPEDTLLAKTLWRPESGWQVDIRREVTETRATVNGGLATRENAYIDMTKAHEIRWA